MTIDDFTFRLIILLIPGFITLQIIKTYSNSTYSELRTFTAFHFILMLIISLVISMVFDLIALIPWLNINSSMFSWIMNYDPRVEKPLTVISFISLCSIGLVLGFFLVWIKKKKFASKIVSSFQISDSFVLEDNWTSFVQAYTGKEWVNIRDYKNKLIYTGMIISISGISDDRDLILTDVTAYKMPDTSKIHFESDKMYIPLTKGEFTIELQ